MSASQALAHVLASLLGSGPDASAMSIAAALATLLVAAVWLLFAPGRWPFRVVGLLSIVAAVLLLVASTVLLSAAGLWWPVAPAVIALLFGQLGVSVGRSVQRPRAAIAPPVAAPRQAPAAPAGASRAAVPSAGSPSTRPPDRSTLGRYRIDRQLGRGAMGAVYLGHDPKIGRQVAIKTMALAQEFDGAELLEARSRFFREAETAGRLQHPDIVTIFDAGEDQDLAYIAMEFLKGHDLQRHTKPADLLPIPQVLRLVARVADALAYAHSQGVVHRDIKPANVMVDFDATGLASVKVTDFGIARITDASRTRTGMVLGTPSFMSPEQMAGQRVDGRSDLYSLGVMLFQLLTGRLPHHAESMAKLMAMIANEPPPDIRTIRADLPEALANAVALALEKRPEVRYADGRQFAADLLAIESLYEPSAASPSAGTSTQPPSSDAFAATVRLSRDDPRHNAPL